MLQLLKEEFCEEEMNRRKYLLENKETIKTDILFPNILQIVLPQKIYMGITGIDRDEIITQPGVLHINLKESSHGESTQ